MQVIAGMADTIFYKIIIVKNFTILKIVKNSKIIKNIFKIVKNSKIVQNLIYFFRKKNNK